jgi:rhamnosyltransferase
LRRVGLAGIRSSPVHIGDSFMPSTTPHAKQADSKTGNMRFRVVAAIVAYLPDVKALSETVDAAADQVTDVVIVANDYASWARSLAGGVSILRQDRNIGLGAAYNLAVQAARERIATHLLLLDQDSLPAPEMVTKLAAAFALYPAAAAAGPHWRDRRTGQDGFFLRGSTWGMHRYRPRAGEIMPVDFLISSGSLISLDAFDDIGPFDEVLFIDHVDSDWSLRARAKGYQLYGVGDARLDHSMGEATRTVSIFGQQRQWFSYPPERNYYRLRNSIALWRRPYVPWSWTAHDVLRTLFLDLFYLTCGPHRLERLRLLLRAVRDGVKL